MRNQNASGIKKITAGTIGMMMFIIVLLSVFHVVAEADHDCSGEGCPICATIRQCETMLRSISDGSTKSSAVIIPFLLIMLLADLFTTETPSNTLISIKVRLNN